METIEKTEYLEQLRKACLYKVTTWFQSIIGDKSKDKHLEKMFFDALSELPEFPKTGKLLIKRGKNYDKSSLAFKALFKRMDISIKHFPEVTITIDTDIENVVVLSLEHQAPISLLTIEQFELTYLEN
jgi:hypothetical protein